MTDKDNTLTKRFFDSHKREIADNGFTQKVMNELPKRKRNTDWIIVFFTFLGMALSVIFIDVEETLLAFFQVMKNIPYYYYFAVISAFPLAFISLYFIRKGKLF